MSDSPSTYSAPAPPTGSTTSPSAAATGPPPERPSLRTATRGAAEQIDLLNALVVLSLGLIFFFAVGHIVLGAATNETATDSKAAWRAADVVMTDIFKPSPGATQPQPACVTDYFDEQTTICGSSFDWPTDSTQRYLAHSLGLSTDHAINVTVEDSTGAIPTENGVRYAMGPAPETMQGSHGVFYRRFVMDRTGDDAAEWYTVTVHVW